MEFSELIETLGMNVYNHRIGMGMSQDDLSKASGVSTSYISLIESCVSDKNPTLKILNDLAGALQVSAADLLAQLEE